MIPAQFQADVDALPPVLRALLDAELAAGNTIVDGGHTHPAPPIGAWIKLARAVTTRARRSGDGLKFVARHSSLYAGEFTDVKGHFFIVEAPLPPPEEPDMDAIRAGRVKSPAVPAPTPPAAAPAAPLRRFEQSMVIDYGRWRDGIGYDLDALRAAPPQERNAIQAMLLARGVDGWREVEALAALDTPEAHAALTEAMRTGNAEVRLAITRHLPALVPTDQRTAALLHALEHAGLFGGLSQAIDQAATFHPPEVVAALLRGALARDGEAATHFAALLFFIHGQAQAPFDWDHRPFFLRFNTDDRAERVAVFRELCAKIGVAPESYLATAAQDS